MIRKIFLCLLVAASCRIGWTMEIEWVTQPPLDGASKSYNSRRPSISANGRYLVFQTRGSFHKKDTNNEYDVYVFDRKLKTKKWISPGQFGVSHGAPTISADGRYIAYFSYPQSVVDGEPPRTSQLILFDQNKQTFVNVTQTLGKQGHNGEAVYPKLNANGRSLVFTSNATDLMDGIETPFRHIYLYRKDRKDLFLLSQYNEKPANRSSLEPIISGKARYVCFKSRATNLYPPLPDTSLGMHLYLLDRKSDDLIRVDQKYYGLDSEKWRVGRVVMDQKAKHLYFEVFPRGMDDVVENLAKSNILKFDVKSRTITEAIPQQFRSGSRNPAVNGNAAFLAFVFRGFSEEDEGGVIIINQKNGTFRKILDGSVRNLSFSQDGKFLVFDSDNPDITHSGIVESHVFVVQNPLY